MTIEQTNYSINKFFQISVQDQTLNCLNFQILMAMKKIKSSNFYKKKKRKCKYYIHLLFFIYSFIYISLLLFCLFFCGVSHPQVQFEIASFNCFCHELLCR